MQLNDRYIKMLTGLNSGLIGYRTMSDLIASDPDAFDDLVKAGYIKKTNTILGWLVTNDARAAMRNFIDAKVLAEKTEVDKPTGFMRPCERCGGTGTVHNGPWVVCCPECDGDGIYHEPEDLSNQPEPDFNQLERDEAARLDVIEDEADLKAYRVEHGDDAPEPLPSASFYGAMPIPVEEGWHKETDSLRQQLADSQVNCIAAQNLARENIEQLAIARATQNQLRDALVAVTAERDALKLQLEMLNTLPIAAQETGRYQEALETILRRAQGGLEYRNVVTLLHRLNEIIRYAEVALNPAE